LAAHTLIKQVSIKFCFLHIYAASISQKKKTIQSVHCVLAYIKTKKYNLINADWEELAKWPCYLQAVANLKPVAKCTAHFLVNMEKSFAVQYEKITCVGFSLGAHVCGLISNYVADKIEKIIGEKD
jgi:hypothetical protein